MMISEHLFKESHQLLHFKRLNELFPQPLVLCSREEVKVDERDCYTDAHSEVVSKDVI